MAQEVVVIGAGVIGLQTANTLLDAGYKVLILAKYWPGDETIEYASPWAGAIWRTHATPDDVDQCQWNMESYKHWMDIMEKTPEEAKKMGLQRVPLTIFSNENEYDPDSPKHWYSTQVQDFSILKSSDLPGNGARSGHSFASFAVNPNVYLAYLLDRAKQLGARTVAAELPVSKGFAHALALARYHITEKYGRMSGSANPPVINCTGLGATGLCNDTAMYPIRGQTLLVRITPAPPCQHILLHDTKPVTYVVPRTGTDLYLLGGTNDANSSDPEPTPSITASILERCKAMMTGWISDDAKIEILSEQVGLRPGRKWGPRLEVEDVEVEIDKEDVRRVRVFHLYGHAGAGFQNSIGCARRALEAVKENGG